MRALVTGATGIVGAETLSQLRRLPGATTLGTSRHGSPATATDPAIVAWDMAAAAPPAELDGPWDAVVHTAADTRWTMDAAAAWRANVATVGALTPLVGPGTHVVHVSTAFATGRLGSVESEREEDYRNTYEWSKAYAERVARSSFPQLTVVRPPLVIGRRADGVAARFAGLYTILRAMTAGMLPAVVAVPDAPLDLVPVDALAELLVAAAQARQGGGTRTIAAGEEAPTVEEAIALVSAALSEWRVEHGAQALVAPRLIDPETWERFFLPLAAESLSPRQMGVLELLANFQPYMTLGQPLRPTDPVGPVDSALAASVRHWAATHRRQALLPIRAWSPRPASATR